ncbi:MAG: hypothetical protein IKO61_07745 [Lachnospiraceae bacterium]|nr:hypothetical protein [Lachnospiraceae bacterium]
MVRLRSRACLLALAAGLLLSAAGCREKQNNDTIVTETAAVSETLESTQEETTTESTETTTEETTEATKEEAATTEERDEKQDPYISPEVIAERFPDDGEYHVEAAGQLYRKKGGMDELIYTPPELLIAYDLICVKGGHAYYTAYDRYLSFDKVMLVEVNLLSGKITDCRVSDELISAYALKDDYEYDRTLPKYELPLDDREKIKEFEAQLEGKYGVIINTYDEARLEINEYNIVEEEDDMLTALALTRLDEAYSQFPEGLIEDINGTGEPLEINIVKEINSTGAENTISNAGGLVSYDLPSPVMTLSTDSVASGCETIFHETMHVIHYRLKNENVWDYVTWDGLNPPGFNYEMSYVDVLPGTYEYTFEGLMDGDYGNVYFVSEYSKRYDTEDVADLMGKLMGGKIIPYYYSGEHMQAKCRQLFYMIRAGYDDSDWPEQTAWEKRIEDAAEGNFGD